jgi:hypothetical protein
MPIPRGIEPIRLPPADRIAERRRHERDCGACGENVRLSGARINIIFDPSFERPHRAAAPFKGSRRVVGF